MFLLCFFWVKYYTEKLELLALSIYTNFSAAAGFFCDGYYCISYSIPDEYKTYESSIKKIAENREVSINMLNVPAFLEKYKNDGNPIGTKFSCETSVFLNVRDIDLKDTFPFKFKDTVIDSNGKSKKKNRSILILTAKEPHFNISDEGTITEIILPEKEMFETPFGNIELFKSDINLKTKIPSVIKIGKTTSLFDPKDYEEKDLTHIKNETELKSLYQTRKGYEKKIISVQVLQEHILQKKMVNFT